MPSRAFIHSTQSLADKRIGQKMKEVYLPEIVEDSTSSLLEITKALGISSVVVKK